MKNNTDLERRGGNLILTGWGWKEYAVAAAVALRALGTNADIKGMSKRRLPEFLEDHGSDYRAIYIIGISLAGDVERLVKALAALRKNDVKLFWISSIPLDAAQATALAPFMNVHVKAAKDGLFNGALVKAAGEYFKEDFSDVLPFAKEGSSIP